MLDFEWNEHTLQAFAPSEGTPGFSDGGKLVPADIGGQATSTGKGDRMMGFPYHQLHLGPTRGIRPNFWVFS